MTVSLTFVLLIRLVPYALVAVYASRKRYKWLTFFAIYLIIVALINAIVRPDADVRALFSSGGALLLLMHALDIKRR
ncbi:hypothetical protein [Curtobacterium sp. MCSS17_007]|uniref:hypothetical protein n=1 Tax=Curtobacterium sp. MCSS17_007 TaxID=2175646 RepID=UPI000DA7745E|nr:hypothetical protein [Curtobacterium sp. MCSS17_007]WIE74473.1 hypothetical protein DEJ22_009275 [Curtobacterium sp. MCSS17_007]